MNTLKFLNECMKSIDGPEIEALADGDSPIEVVENTLNSECVDWDRCGEELSLRDDPDTNLPTGWHIFYLSDCSDFSDPEDYGVSTEPLDVVPFAETYMADYELSKAVHSR
jgi:hypothetical protein